MTVLTSAYCIPKNTFTIKDPYSALTHFIGILYSGILTPFIMMNAIVRGSDNLTLVSLQIFMLSMIFLYSASTIYHTFFISDHISLILKKIDHCMISILIAGTYTPVCLIALRNKGGIRLLTLVWSLAILGIIFKLFWVTCPRWISSCLYIGMGWLCLFSFPTLFHTLSHPSFICLLFGGIIYTVGGVIYAIKPKALSINPNFGAHEVFHICVMVGNLAQFVCIWLCL